jgi:hypothetical protein
LSRFHRVCQATAQPQGLPRDEIYRGGGTYFGTFGGEAIGAGQLHCCHVRENYLVARPDAQIYICMYVCM